MGIIVRTLFQPTLQFGGLIQVQSSLTGANKTWRVYKLTYDLACMTPNGPWWQDVWASPTGPDGCERVRAVYEASCSLRPSSPPIWRFDKTNERQRLSATFTAR